MTPAPKRLSAVLAAAALLGLGACSAEAKTPNPAAPPPSVSATPDTDPTDAAEPLTPNSNDTEEGRAKNRRTEFKLLKARRAGD